MVELRDSSGRHWQITIGTSEATCDDEKITNEHTFEIDARPNRLWVDGQLAHVVKVKDDWWIHINGRIHVVHGHEPGSADSAAGEGGLTAPMPGTILEVHAKAGQRVREGQTLLVMEAMKMEHRIQAPKAGEVLSVNFAEGERVDMGATLVELGD